MNLEEELKNIILSRYKSVNDFANAIGVPQSTIASIFKRGIGKAGVQTVLKIFNALDLDIESISTGNLRASQRVSDAEFTKKYRALDEHGKKLVDAVLDIEYERVAGAQHRLRVVAAENGQRAFFEERDELPPLLPENPPDV